MDSSLFNYYDCTLCDRKGIHETTLLKHQMKWHRNTPYRMDQFKLAKTARALFQCKVCQSIVDGPAREEHQRKSHPMFKTQTGLFDGVTITRDLLLGVEYWSNNKDAPTVLCTRCRTNISQKDFMEHTQLNHPECLLPSYSVEPIAPPQLDSTPSFDQQEKKDKVPGAAPVATSKDTFNCASIHVGMDQTVSASNNVNNIFAVQQSLETAKDASLTNYYDCTMCAVKGIEEINLARHHKKFHRNVPYQVDRYTLAKTIQYHYQCKICLEIVEGPYRDEHQEKNHPMFKTSSGLFESLRLTRDLRSGVANWSNNKDATESECVCCKSKIHYTFLVEHMQLYHPKRLKKSFIRSLDANNGAKKQENAAMMVPTDEVNKQNLMAKDGNGDKNEMTGKGEAAKEVDNGKGAKGTEPDNVRELFECALCRTNDIPKQHRLKHHTKFHPNTPYQAEFYIFTKTTRKMIQCKVCDVILIEPLQDDHRRTHHPMFKKSEDLFERLLLVDDPKRGEQKWIGNKDAARVNCHRCNHHFHKNVFLSHFQRAHKKYVNLLRVKESMIFSAESNSKRSETSNNRFGPLSHEMTN